MDKKQAKVGKVMREFKEGKLKSSSGQKVTNPKQAIAIGLSEAGMSKKMAAGGSLKEVDTDKNPGLAKLPEDVRNKMGYLKKGGMMKDMKKGYAAGGRMASKGEHAVQKHSKRGAKMVKMAAGGLASGHKSADGCAVKGKTKAKQVTMKKGGYC
jgi:hypothetical protein